jgi:hypothetical protein
MVIVLHRRRGQMRRLMARRWADRIVRTYASGALRGAGFTTAARALESAPELGDDESYRDQRARVDAALSALLAAREVPWIEQALVATFAAREALIVAGLEQPTTRHLTSMVAVLQECATT